MLSEDQWTFDIGCCFILLDNGFIRSISEWFRPNLNYTLESNFFARSYPKFLKNIGTLVKY